MKSNFIFKLTACACLTPLEKGTEYKNYAPGVGLVKDGKLHLVKYGGGAK